MTATPPTRRWLVEGRVQGVGFRWFVLREAGALGLAGWVENLPDGRVDVVAQGPSAALDSLDAALRAGPRFARVDRVETGEYPHEVDASKQFHVK